MADDLLAEFETPEALLEAIARCRAAELYRLEAFTPYPIHEVQEALAMPLSPIPGIVFATGMIGAIGTFFFQWWMNGFSYPINVGGRPLASLPAFIPTTFEGGVLAASFFALLAFLIYTGLPRLWHPVFEIEGFERASIDRFFLRVDARQQGFDVDRVVALLSRTRALRVSTILRAGAR